MSVYNYEQSFGRLMGVTNTALFRRLSKLMKEADLPITPDQFRVLTHLWQKDGRTQNELAICSNRNRANVTRLIDILEREGIVKRHDDPNDRRVFKIYLTDKGKSIENKAAICADQAINDALKNFSSEERNTLEALLIRVKTNLNQRS